MSYKNVQKKSVKKCPKHKDMHVKSKRNGSPADSIILCSMQNKVVGDEKCQCPIRLAQVCFKTCCK